MYRTDAFQLVFILIVIFVSSCREETYREERSTPVQVTSPEAHEPYLTKSYPSIIQASSDVNLSFRVPGPVMEVYVREGDEVREGQLLARLDPRDYETQLEATKAEYEGIKAEAERIISLYERGRVSTSEYDKVVTGLQQITAKYRAHQDALNDTRLKAPFKGQISQIFFDRSEITDAGMPVMSLSSHQELEVLAHLPDRDLMRKDDFVSFLFTTRLYPDTEFPLVLRNIGKVPGLSGMYPAYFDMKRDPSHNFLPGMRVEVNITYRRDTNAFFNIPSTAIFYDGEQARVWRVSPDDQTVHPVPVEIIRIGNSGEATVRADLIQDDILVRSGVHSLYEGQTVSPREEPADTNVGDLL